MRLLTILAAFLTVVHNAAADSGARYLVIADDELIPALQPLVEWRHAQGLRAQVIPTSTTGHSLTEIHDYIEDAWSTWPIRPEFVLLVGHPSSIPAARYGTTWRYYTDNDYANLTGDIRAEVAIGRFPVRSATQLAVIVDKILTYEKSPDSTDTLWTRRLTTVLREDGDVNDTIYWNDMRHAASLAGTAGFVNCDSFSRLRGDDSVDVYASLANGASYIMYRGSAVGNWARPFRILPHETANHNRLPVVLSITCGTMTLDPYDSMVGRAWLMAGSSDSLIGGVAFFGNSRIAHWVSRIRSVIARGFFTALLAEDYGLLGSAILRAKELLYQAYPEEIDEYRGFNVFGDPALRLWTGAPRRLDVSHPDTVPLGPGELNVAVRHRGVPVAGAVVCISMDTTVYVCDTTDGSGSVSLRVAPTDTGSLRVVVTGQNLLPHDGLIVVTSHVGLVGPNPAPHRTMILEAVPSAFRGMTSVRWAKPVGRGWSLRLTDVLGRRGLSLPIEEGADEADIASPFPPGVYLVVLRDEHDRAVGSTRLTRLQ